MDFASAVFDAANSPTRPAGDPDGSRLVAHANEAASRWERVIRDAHSISLTVRYDAAAPDTGRLEILGVSGGRATSIRIRVKPSLDWFFDPTPADDSEFALTERFAEAESPLDALYPFRGSPPGRLETALSGAASGVNATRIDLLTVLLHHLGRSLGFSDIFSSARTEIDGDGDVDLPADWVADATMAVKDDTRTDPDDYSLMTVSSVLNQLSIAVPGRRCLPSTLDYLVVGQCGGWSIVRVPRLEFLRTGTQQFRAYGNWPANNLPDFTSVEALFLRQTAVTNVSGHVNTNAPITISGASTLTIPASGTETSGSGTLTLLHDGNAFRIPQLISSQRFTASGDFRVTGGIADMKDDLTCEQLATSAAAVTGRRGRLKLSSAVVRSASVMNDGIIEVLEGTCDLLPRAAQASFTCDLDGTSAEPGSILVQPGAVLRVGAGAVVASPLTGELDIRGSMSSLASVPVTLGASSRLLLAQDGIFDWDNAVLGGTIECTGSASIRGSGTLTAGCRVTLPPAGQTLNLGGRFQINSGITLTGSGSLTASNYGTSPRLVVQRGTYANLRLRYQKDLQIDDDLSGPGGTLSMESLTAAAPADSRLGLDIGGTADGTFDRVVLSGAADLAGRLSVTFSGPAPQPGQQWRVLSAATRTGVFSALEITGADAAEFELLYDATGVTLRMKSDPTLAEWLAARGVPESLRGKNDDPDKDGVPNATEALFALNPMSADRPHFVSGITTIGGQRYGTVEARINEIVFADIALKVEASADLQSWDLPLGVTGSAPAANGTVLRTWQLTHPVTAEPAAWFRAAALSVVDRPNGPL